MTVITRTYPTFKITKQGESVSVVVDKRTVQITTPALQGVAGLSAYAVALKNGFVWTEAEWLASLEWPEGPVGPSVWGGIGGDINTQTDLVEMTVALSIALW